LVLRERFVLEPDSPAFAAMKQPFPLGHYASACVISEAAWADDAWVGEINAIQSDDIRIGVSRLVAAGWSIKLLAADSLALQRATAQLRQVLVKFFPAQDHHSRIFGFSH
jgi:urease accessory protein UreH